MNDYDIGDVRFIYSCLRNICLEWVNKLNRIFSYYKLKAIVAYFHQGGQIIIMFAHILYAQSIGHVKYEFVY